MLSDECLLHARLLNARTAVLKAQRHVSFDLEFVDRICCFE